MDKSLNSLKAVGWKEVFIKSALEIVFVVVYFITMSFILRIILSFSADPLPENLLHALVIMTTLITYFMMSDRRNIEKELGQIEEKLDDVWVILMAEGDEFSDRELEEYIEELQQELEDRKSED
jgi:hypothetical protein